MCESVSETLGAKGGAGMGGGSPALVTNQKGFSQQFPLSRTKGHLVVE